MNVIPTIFGHSILISWEVVLVIFMSRGGISYFLNSYEMSTISFNIAKSVLQSIRDEVKYLVAIGIRTSLSFA